MCVPACISIHTFALHVGLVTGADDPAEVSLKLMSGLLGFVVFGAPVIVQFVLEPTSLTSTFCLVMITVMRAKKIPRLGVPSKIISVSNRNYLG